MNLQIWRSQTSFHKSDSQGSSVLKYCRDRNDRFNVSGTFSHCEPTQLENSLKLRGMQVAPKKKKKVSGGIFWAKWQRCMFMWDVSLHISDGSKSGMSDGRIQHQQKEEKVCTHFNHWVLEACQNFVCHPDQTLPHTLFYIFLWIYICRPHKYLSSHSVCVSLTWNNLTQQPPKGTVKSKQTAEERYIQRKWINSTPIDHCSCYSWTEALLNATYPPVRPGSTLRVMVQPEVMIK